jgi:hypothetical protein
MILLVSVLRVGVAFGIGFMVDHHFYGMAAGLFALTVLQALRWPEKRL